MAFYENTIIARQDLAEKDIDDIKNKYTSLIDSSAGKVIKIEMWGLINFVKKIKKHNKGFFIHYKFEGNKNTLDKINKSSIIDNSVLRHLTIKYKKLDTETEYFKERNIEKKK